MSTSQYLAEHIHSILYQLFVERLLDAKHSMVFAIKEELGPGCSPVETAEVYGAARCKLCIKTLSQNLQFNICN